MAFDSRLGQATAEILAAFRTGTLPAALAQRYLEGYDYPARRYSPLNQLWLNLQGDPDARGYRAWTRVGRHVRRGERSRYVLAPRVGRVQQRIDQVSGQALHERPLVGWQYLPVFGYDQTDGTQLLERERSREQQGAHLAQLPLRAVAHAWGLGIEQSDRARERAALGWYSPAQDRITLGVENLATWAHELVHAADHRARNLDLSTLESRASAEVVAELGGAILLTALGYREEADLGGSWRYLQAHGGKNTLATIDRLLDRTTAAVDLLLTSAAAAPDLPPTTSSR